MGLAFIIGLLDEILHESSPEFDIFKWRSIIRLGTGPRRWLARSSPDGSVSGRKTDYDFVRDKTTVWRLPALGNSETTVPIA
jgi:hypothetical protein